jgi:hypothetical protein
MLVGVMGLYGGAHEWRTADASPALRSSRDDKKERVVARKGWLLEERATQPVGRRPRTAPGRDEKCLDLATTVY